MNNHTQIVRTALFFQVSIVWATTYLLNSSIGGFTRLPSTHPIYGKPWNIRWYIFISNQPMCPPIILIIRWCISNPRVYSRGALGSAPKIKFSKLSSHQFIPLTSPSRPSTSPPPYVTPTYPPSESPPIPSLPDTTTNWIPFTLDAATPPYRGT